MSGTKSQLFQWNKNQQNKNCLGPLDFGYLGTPSLSTKRSERNKNEQNKNCVTQWNKNQWNKNWWGPLNIGW